MSNFEEIWTKELETVNSALADYLDFKISQISKLGKYHTQFYEYLKEYFMRGGKRLRPILVAIGYKAINEDVHHDHLYRAACSMEILHNGTLLHDDLIDHDETRRGGPTFHARYRDAYLTHTDDQQKAFGWGMTMAIIGGDILLNMGAQAIQDSELDDTTSVKCLTQYQTAYQYLGDGVMLEMNMVYEPTVTPEIYLKMVSLKTAVLFYTSLLIGATIARASESQLAALHEFGFKVGQAFQMQDDILGSFGDESVTGKSADGDIREGKKTMLLLKSYELANLNQKKIIDDLLGKDDMTKEEVEQVRNVFKQSGGFDATNTLMEQLLAEGQAALDSAQPPLTPKYKEFLLALSEFLTKRDY
ncbi:MAG: polyprenyl synthetase family protein [Candidatus Thorarchaeota archaeon]